MSYRVWFTQTVADKVAALHPEIKKQLRAACKQISNAPYSGKELQEDLLGFLSYRFQRYRIIYRVDETEKSIIVCTIGHRRDVYELFAEYVNSETVRK